MFKKIGQAILQITPSISDADMNKVDNEMSNKMQASGEKSGKLFGKGFMTPVKLLASAVAATVGAMVIGGIKEAVSGAEGLIDRTFGILEQQQRNRMMGEAFNMTELQYTALGLATADMGIKKDDLDTLARKAYELRTERNRKLNVTLANGQDISFNPADLLNEVEGETLLDTFKNLREYFPEKQDFDTVMTQMFGGRNAMTMNTLVEGLGDDSLTVALADETKLLIDNGFKPLTDAIEANVVELKKMSMALDIGSESLVLQNVGDNAADATEFLATISERGDKADAFIAQNFDLATTSEQIGTVKDEVTRAVSGGVVDAVQSSPEVARNMREASTTRLQLKSPFEEGTETTIKEISFTMNR